MLQIYRAI